MRLMIGIAGRVVFWLSAVWIVGSAAVSLWQAGAFVLAVAALVFFPVTYFVFPLLSGAWWLLALSVGAYATSTFVGGMSPVD